jgi:hypothetical protein
MYNKRLKNKHMGCGCKNNKQNQSSQQTQNTQVKTESIQNAVKKTVESNAYSKQSFD